MNADNILYSPIGDDSEYRGRIWEIFLRTVPPEIDFGSFSDDDITAIQKNLWLRLKRHGNPEIKSPKELEDLLCR